MSIPKTKNPQISKIYQESFRALKAYPSLMLPFLIFALAEAACLIILFLSPRMPFIKIFGPPIRTFWGEMFLHYPANFLLLPKLESFSRTFLSVVIGSLLTGIAVSMVFAMHNKKRPGLSASFRLALKKYILLFSVVFIINALFYGLEKIVTLGLVKYFQAGHTRLLFLSPGFWMGPILICINFVFAVLVQCAFIFSIPALIIDDDKLIKALGKAILLFKNFFGKTVILVALPMLAYIPIIVLNFNNAFLIDKLFPEIVLIVSILAIIISSLVIDLLVTISTTLFYLEIKDK